jgi:tRNA(fMet)-specific endonuclease VapC
MTYLLDTNVAIALINGRPASVRSRFRDAVARNESISMSSVVLFELWYGVARSERRRENAERLRAFRAGPINIAVLDEEDATIAGDLGAALEKAGRPIGPYDLLIAAQVLRFGATLVTANVSEFDRVPGLSWQDWSAGTAKPP